MRAEIICVGTEILLGNIVNTNAAYLAKECALIGLELYHQSVIGDNHERLRETVIDALKRSDCLILTGGLGPTYDDLTKETIASLFHQKLVLNPLENEKLEHAFQVMGRVMTENNRKQAYLPERSSALANRVGTAPGVYLEEQGKIVILLPGPPYEMRIMFEEQVKPRLLAKADQCLVSKTIRIFGMGESEVESRLHEVMIKTTNPTLAPYAKVGECEVRVTAKAGTETAAAALIEPYLQKVKDILGQVVYGVDIPNLEAGVVDALHQRQETLAILDGFSGRSIQRLKEEDMHYVLKQGTYRSAYPAYETWEEWVLENARTIREECRSTYGAALIGCDNPDDDHFGQILIAVSSEQAIRTYPVALRRGYSDLQGYMHTMSASHLFSILLKQLRQSTETIQ